MEVLFIILFMLLAAHWLADYPLQGDFLASAKQKGPLRFYHLVAHAGIHGAFVMVITGSWILGLTEWVAHTIIDELKVRGKTTFAIDQVLHISCKVAYVIILGTGILT
jgi:hypothetical protein